MEAKTEATRVFAFSSRMLPSAASLSQPGGSPVAGLGGSPPPVIVSSQEVGQKERNAEEISATGSGTSVGVGETYSKINQEASSIQGKRNQIGKPSWVNVAKKHIFSQQKFVVSEIDGKEKVVVPKDVFAGAKPLWEDFLIGKFLNTKAPHVGKIHMIVNKIWRLGDRSSLIDVFEVNQSTVKFRIRNEGMRQRILNRGMWNITDIPMIVSKWTPFAEEAQPAMKSIPLWVTLTNVPPMMFTDKGLEFLASAVGKPIRLHPKTDVCVCFDEAQIMVEADLTKELLKEYNFTGEEEGELDSVIKYSYPWLPPRCGCCKKWGHLRETCLSPENKSTLDTSALDLLKVNDVVTNMDTSPGLQIVSEQPAHVECDLQLQEKDLAAKSSDGAQIEAV